MTYAQFNGPLNMYAIQQAMKPDERIVCTNATVIMDKNENLSYFNNDIGVCMIMEDKEDN